MRYEEGEPIYSDHFKTHPMDVLAYREAARKINREQPYPIGEHDPEPAREPMVVGKVYELKPPSKTWMEMANAHHEAMEEAGIPDMCCFGAEANWYAWYRAESIRHMIVTGHVYERAWVVAAVALAMDEVSAAFPDADAGATEPRGAYSYYLAEAMEAKGWGQVLLDDHCYLADALKDENIKRVAGEYEAELDAHLNEVWRAAPWKVIGYGHAAVLHAAATEEEARAWLAENSKDSSSLSYRIGYQPEPPSRYDDGPSKSAEERMNWYKTLPEA